jgi:Fe-S cluster assembly protein SufD
MRAAIREAFEHVAPHLPGARHAAWAQARSTALERFVTQGLPTLRDEDWKYTDLRFLERHKAVLTAPSTLAPGHILETLPQWNLAESRMVFLDGHYLPELSTAPSQAGVHIHSLAESIEAGAEPITSRHDTGFRALNAALLSDGAVIELETDTVLESPLLLLFIGTGVQDGLNCVRNILRAGARSQATIIECHTSLASDACLDDAVTHIELGAGSDITHVLLLEQDAAALHYGAVDATLAAQARYHAHVHARASRLLRQEFTVALEGEGADCQLNALYTGCGRGHVDNHTRIEHHAPGCVSREWYRGILADHARGIFTGRIVVEPGAVRTDARQESRQLLLSGHAEADSRPQLEIHADDVQCAHGATVGQLDADALFYLRARGLDERTARAMLVRAFAGAVLARFPLDGVRAHIENRLGGLLDGGMH